MKARYSTQLHVLFGFAGLVLAAAIAVGLQEANLLGPYGLPGDNLHLLILIAALWTAYFSFITFAIFWRR